MRDSGLKEFSQKVGARAGAPKASRTGSNDSITDYEEEVQALNAKCWAITGNAYFPVSETTKKLPGGAYKCRECDRGPFLEKMPIEYDDLLHLPDSTVEYLLKEFNIFWKLRDNFDQRGFTFKRGILMWGPPGSGKTSAIWQMTEDLISTYDGVVLFVENPSIALPCVSVLRKVEPDRKLVCIYEDIDSLIERHGSHGFLAILDGETQFSNVVHLATTNYPELLDARFVDRPSRFDTIMKVDMPSWDARYTYFKTKEPTLTEDELERWVKKSDGFSIAHLREVIVAIKCFEQDENDVFERLNDMRVKKSSGDDGEKVGF